MSICQVPTIKESALHLAIIGKPGFGTHHYGKYGRSVRVYKGVPFADKCSNSGNESQYSLNISRSRTFRRQPLRLCLASHFDLNLFVAKEGNSFDANFVFSSKHLGDLRV